MLLKQLKNCIFYYIRYLSFAFELFTGLTTFRRCEVKIGLRGGWQG